MTREESFKIEALDHVLTKVLDDIDAIKFDMANEKGSDDKTGTGGRPSASTAGSNSGSDKRAAASKSTPAKKSTDPSRFEYAGKQYMMKRERIRVRIRDTYQIVNRKDLHDNPSLLRVAMVNHPYHFTPLKSVEEVEKEQKKTTATRKSTKSNPKK